MIRQLVKLCWNRKRSQALVAVEVFFSFLVVFAVMTVAVYNVHNYRQPLGFDYHDVLNVNLTSLSDVAAGGGKKAVVGRGGAAPAERGCAGSTRSRVSPGPRSPPST